ncbi:hypothetical protein J5X84_23205 [Streptosporangiaceae bacterium NEAU-GS5]|nr:hypothetical protein [Streptosporangiaceae bacterium NEAU-GS5]
MRRTPLLTLLCALLAAIFGPAAFPAAAGADAAQTFSADSLSSLDSCPHGITRGVIDWHVVGGPAGTSWADLSGVLLDRPLPADPSTACANDGYYSAGLYTAFSATGAVQTATVRADNQNVPVKLALGDRTSHIVRIVVQVCRHPLAGTTPVLPPSYCGRAQTYNIPPVV